jgi:hypothetical protein
MGSTYMREENDVCCLFNLTDVMALFWYDPTATEAGDLGLRTLGGRLVMSLIYTSYRIIVSRGIPIYLFFTSTT